jgi:hypothetical protein
MKIKQITSQHRNDYSAIMECEHCTHTQEDKYGYFDNNYMENVIPAMTCQNCGKNRAGEITLLEKKT